MDFSNGLNSFGLVVDIIGVVIVYLNSPKVDSLGGVYFQSESHGVNAKDGDKNDNVKKGMIILGIGFVIQLASNFF